MRSVKCKPRESRGAVGVPVGNLRTCRTSYINLNKSKTCFRLSVDFVDTKRPLIKRPKSLFVVKFVLFGIGYSYYLGTCMGAYGNAYTAHIVSVCIL